jgi:chromosome segregation ATPase
MIAKLEKEAEEDATEKAYCDEEMGKNKAKKEELSTDIKKLTSKIDVASSRSVDLKAQVKELQKELADLQEMQSEMDKVRADAKAAFTQAKSDLEAGITGVGNALSVLRDYYASEDAALLQQPAAPTTHSKASGAGGGIISMLEVILSDFTKGLAEQETEESTAQADYEKSNTITSSIEMIPPPAPEALLCVVGAAGCCRRAASSDA